MQCVIKGYNDLDRSGKFRQVVLERWHRCYELIDNVSNQIAKNIRKVWRMRWIVFLRQFMQKSCC